MLENAADLRAELKNYIFESKTNENRPKSNLQFIENSRTKNRLEKIKNNFDNKLNCELIKKDTYDLVEPEDVQTNISQIKNLVVAARKLRLSDQKIYDQNKANLMQNFTIITDDVRLFKNPPTTKLPLHVDPSQKLS